MTVAEALQRLDTLHPNHYTKAEKLVWLNRMEYQLLTELLMPLGLMNQFTPYTEQTPDDTLLLAPAPFDGMYDHWLESQLFYVLRDFHAYNRAVDLYNRWYAQYIRYVLRESKLRVSRLSVLS
ncbi:MAG: hypothetical protein IKT68_00980 [Clostridia bacterium]|nr:hypothetical protein [Clostridia bacterium]